MAFKCNFTFLKLSYDFNLKLGNKQTNMICESYIGGLGSMPGWGRPSGGGHGNSFQYSCLEKSHGWRSLMGTIHGVTKSQT